MLAIGLKKKKAVQECKSVTKNIGSRDKKECLGQGWLYSRHGSVLPQIKTV